MDIIGRAKWGARAPRSRSTVRWSQRTEFIVHYSEGPTNQSVRGIQDFHMDVRGWSDIGYNFLVDVSGRIYEGRGWLVVGAHAPDHNTSGIGVCMIGRDGDSTPAAKRSIRALYDEAVRRKGGNLDKLGHRDVFATSCPGYELYAWVRAGMPADIEEDDVSAQDVWNHRIKTDDNQTMKAGTILGHMEKSQDRIEALLVGLASRVGADVDEDAIVAGVLAGLTPERIAAAIPRDIGEQVAEALAVRLAAGKE